MNSSNQVGASKAYIPTPPLKHGWLADRPWLWIVGGFLAVIGIWTGFIFLAVRNQSPDVRTHPESLHVGTVH